MALAPRTLYSILSVVGAFALATLIVMGTVVWLWNKQNETIPSPEGLPTPPSVPEFITPESLQMASSSNTAATGTATTSGN